MNETNKTHLLKPLKVISIHDLADDIKAYEFADPEGADLAPFTPGAHVTVQVPNGSLRKYSLCNPPSERHRYVIAVKRDAQGRGGSRSMSDDCHAGDLVPVSLPDNAFPMTSSAPSYLFIAGGIGITPIRAMIAALEEAGKERWRLYYFTRNPETTAFLAEFSDSRYRGKVVIHHDHGDASRSFDLWPVLERFTGAHVYCCGPRGLMDSVRDMSGHWPQEYVHFESFVDGASLRSADDKPFIVRLEKAGTTVSVPVGISILEALRESGHAVPASCESGSCGSCRTRLISGKADHRDFVLTPGERNSNIMVCVSRALCEELVLDL